MSQITGSAWYLLAIERQDTCWQETCKKSEGCIPHFLYCEGSNRRYPGFETWKNVSKNILNENCGTDGDDPPFDYGIYTRVVEKGIVASKDIGTKFCFCLWWGLQNVRSLSHLII